MAATVGAFAQGTINFNNNITGTFQSRIYGVETSGDTSVQRRGQTAGGNPVGTTVYTGLALAGTGFTAQLWGAAGANQAEGVLAALATTSFRTGTATGLVDTTKLPAGNALIAVPGAPLDGASYKGTFQVRAWDNQNGAVTTWAMVMANDAIARGTSLIVSPGGDLGGTGTPAATAPTLAGMGSFNLFVPVPEPSLIALGALGLGALLIRRRKA